ncbi:NAD(P)-dependent oxidoreductase [Hymenobacter sediminis]|uniref:NAD(P)-dependent oxidoreductase n=1 Tax=Hymenobacter sediminis TaxID=2218621 RepID=UPI000DA6CBD8|nr:NAD(P)-binding oxidoreductase [Hymenobacter sediminis]RPD45725.1 NAD(P)-dependent oxidoreductase [Hymenobacter sediminis]
MNLTIIGASSGVGLLAVQQALSQGHRVTTLSRTVATLPEHPGLTKVVGSATVAADLRRVLPGAEAVLITVGTAKKNATPLFTDTARALLEATADMPLTAPVLVLTGFGAGGSAPYLNWWMRLAIRWFMQPEYDNKTQLEELLAASALCWEIVRPGMLTNGPLAPYQVLPDLTPSMQVSRISRASVADFMLRQAQQPTLLYHYPALTG